MNPSTDPTFIFTDTGHKNSFHVINSYNPTDVDEGPHILELLSPLEPCLREWDVRHDVLTRRLDGLGVSFLHAEFFINWRDGRAESSMATLFGSGAP